MPVALPAGPPAPAKAHPPTAALPSPGGIAVIPVLTAAVLRSPGIAAALRSFARLADTPVLTGAVLRSFARVGITPLRTAAMLLSLAGCGLPPSSPQARTWITADFPAAARAGRSFGGLPADGLVTFEGEPIDWRAPPYEPAAAVQAPGTGLSVLPAFADGQTAAWVITEIWLHHPAPWVQPVYLPVTGYDPAQPTALRLEGARTVFGVGGRASFYSPFWRLQVAVVPPGTPLDALKDVRGMLAAATGIHDGPLVLCPVIPADVSLAHVAGEPPRRPFTFEALKERPLRTAWVDGREEPYVDFGPDRFVQRADALVLEEPVFFFTPPSTGGERPPLPLPAVLPRSPFRSSLLRRTDVVFTPDLAVFVPASLPALRDELAALGLKVPAASPALLPAVAAAYTLRVAADSSCFADPAAFPAGCRWLDSQDAIEAGVARHNVLPTGTLLTGATLQLGAVVR